MRRRAVGVGVALGLLAGFAWLGSRGGSGALPRDVEDAGGSRRVTRAEATHPAGPPAGAGPEAAGRPSEASEPAGGAASDAPGSEPTDEELLARAAALEADPNTHVACDLGVPVRSGVGYLAIGDPSGFNGRKVEVVNGRAYLPLVYDLGELGDAVFEERSGVFALEGYGPGSLSWSDPPEGGGLGRCTSVATPEPGHASLTGTLTLDPGGAPAAHGWVEGCGNLAYADERGVVHMAIVSTPCTVIAMRQDGALRTMSPPVEITPRPGQDVVVDFTIPAAPRAGLGVRVAEAEGGVLVEGVIEGGPAATAGLEAGDLVTDVDGVPAGDLPSFVEAAGGAADTSVVLGVQRDGARIELTVVRGTVPG